GVPEGDPVRSGQSGSEGALAGDREAAVIHGMTRHTLRLAASLLLLAIGSESPLAAQAPPKPQGPPPSVCPTTAVNRQLDFWIGHWDVAPWNAPAGTPPAAAGTSVIEPDVAQCVINESWHGAAGGAGKSINFYDVNRKAWRQVWVATGGGSLDYSGEFRDGAMRFEGWTLGANGQKVLQRLTFTPIGRDTVRQTFLTSTDEGKNWVTGFDARYVRQAAKSPATAP